MNNQGLTLIKDMVGFGLIALFLFLFFVMDLLGFDPMSLSVPGSWLNVNTIFISIVLEAIPFILLGVFFSALIQTYVSEETIQRFIPKNAIVALVPAALLAVVFPICECAIVPVVRRLIKKGMPLHVGVVLLVGAPVLNPIVLASTYYAFRGNLDVVYGRMGLAFVLSIFIGLIIYLLYQNSNQLRWSRDELLGLQPEVPKVKNRFKSTLYHASDEFFEMGKYLIVGAFVASLFQTFLDRDVLLDLGSSETAAPAVMMAFAYVLSLCSEADAFVAATFGNTFSIGAILAFLVYGPMLDLKNTIMLFAFFRARFVFGLIVVITVSVYCFILLYQAIM
ncbi:permease [Bacillus pinisoli]|uniref:permease n=1 Tax=Bacillus pinisoli TaxID=2901866 RepID=UPI001FF18FA7|nr:permease [Bacillus pinisoli]